MKSYHADPLLNALNGLGSQGQEDLRAREATELPRSFFPFLVGVPFGSDALLHYFFQARPWGASEI